jgi:hypothetical protein
MSTQITPFAHIDDILGDGASRFFGSGYRRVRHLLGPMEHPDSEVGLATAILDYPADWSVKANAASR